MLPPNEKPKYDKADNHGHSGKTTPIKELILYRGPIDVGSIKPPGELPLPRG